MLPIIGPTYEEMLHPWTLDPKIRALAIKMKDQDPLHPINLFNISWRNEKDHIPHLVLPPVLTGVKANIVVMTAKHFPSGSHKVGPTYSVLAEKTVTGQVDPTKHQLVWPSTGNYGVGGAWVSSRMNYKSLVILPEEMSKERFDIIRGYGSEVIATPGCESNVKEIYDKTKELVEGDPDHVRILNQFESFANYRFHYHVTGTSMVELIKENQIGNGQIAAVALTVGSGGTLASGDKVKAVYPQAKIVAGEPLQCPTLSLNGYGAHDIQGIGDKHVTWIHNTMNTDGVVLLDDMDAKSLLKVFTCKDGQAFLADLVGQNLAKSLSTDLGISGCANILAAIKTAKYYDLKAGDNVVTVATDSLDRYYSVLDQMCDPDLCQVQANFERILLHQGPDPFFEGDKNNRLRWHNLKYYTWIEQQCKDLDDLNAMKDQTFWLKEAQAVNDMNHLMAKWRADNKDQLASVFGYARPLYDIRFEKGRVYTTQGWQKTHLYVRGERIACISDEVHDAKQVVNCEGYDVLPGLIDPHVHMALKVGGTQSYDDFDTGSRQALLGGVTTLIDFTRPITQLKDLDQAFVDRLNEAASSCVDYALHATLGNYQGRVPDLVQEVKARGMSSIKVFTTYASSNRMIDPHVLKGLLNQEDIITMVHAEDNELVDDSHKNIGTYESSRPLKSELNALKNLMQIKGRGRLYVAHVSSGSGVELLSQDPSIMIESCPHYMWLDKTMFCEENGGVYLLAPPLRSKEEVEKLKSLRHHLTTIGTDHCPFTLREKIASDDAGVIPKGIGSIKYSYLLMYTLFGHDMIACMTSHVARAFGLEHKGKLQVGYDADIVLFDPKAKTQVVTQDETSYSVYEGLSLSGAIRATYLRGHLAMQEGKIHKTQGRYTRGVIR